MDYQRFIPEGWINKTQEFNENIIQTAYKEGNVLQGYVNDCDLNYNLHVNLGNNINGCQLQKWKVIKI